MSGHAVADELKRVVETLSLATRNKNAAQEIRESGCGADAVEKLCLVRICICLRNRFHPREALRSDIERSFSASYHCDDSAVSGSPV